MNFRFFTKSREESTDWLPSPSSTLSLPPWFVSLSFLSTFSLQLSAAVLSQMSDRKKGIIVNVASSASYNPMALWAVYSATKKYVTWFTSILRREYESRGITVQTICPMMVATKMSKVFVIYSLFLSPPSDQENFPVRSRCDRLHQVCREHDWQN